MDGAPLDAMAAEAFGRRVDAGTALADAAERLASACRDMAVRFQRGGTLLAFGNGGPPTPSTSPSSSCTRSSSASGRCRRCRW